MTPVEMSGTDSEQQWNGILREDNSDPWILHQQNYNSAVRKIYRPRWRELTTQTLSEKQKNLL